MSSSALERAILEVIAYFDIFAYPLTVLEVWRKVKPDASYREVYAALQSSPWLQARVGCANGTWYLKSRLRSLDLIGERPRRYRASKHKIEVASRYARLLGCLPWVEGVYGCNSLGFLHARPESDIDLFIVARRGRIWCTRFFAVLIAKLFGRPSVTHAKDRLCLSFFAVSGANLKKLALDGEDIYFKYWLENLLTIWERKKTGEQIKLRKIGDLLESWLQYVQLRIMPAALTQSANKGTNVVINDEVLKFHDHDRRDYYRRQWKERLASLDV